MYYQVEAAIEMGITIQNGVEFLDGREGFKDTRFVNEFGYYKRATGAEFKRLMKEKRDSGFLPCRGVEGSNGCVDWNCYE